jgi:hypothetical protein
MVTKSLQKIIKWEALIKLFSKKFMIAFNTLNFYSKILRIKNIVNKRIGNNLSFNSWFRLCLYRSAVNSFILYRILGRILSIQNSIDSVSLFSLVNFELKLI